MTQKFSTQEFTLTIESRKNRLGEKEGFDCIEIRPGDTLSKVSPTGSGCPLYHALRVLSANSVTGVLECHTVGPMAARK